jgi:hypothetical protein
MSKDFEIQLPTPIKGIDPLTHEELNNGLKIHNKIIKSQGGKKKGKKKVKKKNKKKSKKKVGGGDTNYGKGKKTLAKKKQVIRKSKKKSKCAQLLNQKFLI